MQAFVCIGTLESECPFLLRDSPVAPHFRACSLDGLACSEELPIHGIEIWVGGWRLERNVAASIGREHRGWRLELNSAARIGRRGFRVNGKCLELLDGTNWEA